MTQPDRASFIELPTRTLPYWDVGSVRAALDAHEVGQLQQSSLLCEAMDRDDRIKAVRDTRIQALLGLPRHFKPANESPQAKRAAATLEANWDSYFPSGDLAQLMRWATGVGTGLAELVWSVRDGLYSPRLKPWHPQFLHWRWDLHDAAGGWQLITQTASVEPVPGAGKWLLVQPGGARRPWMAGGVRALAIPYLMRGYAYRDWANYSEVHGGGIKKALVPSEAPEADKQLFFQSIQTLGAHGLVVLPVSLDGKPAFDLQMLEATSSGWEGFEKLIARTDDSIAISELGQNLTTQVDGGSRAAASVHDKVRGDVMEADSLTMCGAIREQVLRPWARYNFGDPDLAPIPSYDATPPVDQQKVAATWKAVADALHAFQAAKIPVNAQALLDQAGVPTAKGPISQEQN